MTEGENEQRFADRTLYRAAAGAADRALYRDDTFDVRMRIVINQLEILILKIEDVIDRRIDKHFGKRTRIAGKLELHLLHVVEVDVGIA